MGDCHFIGGPAQNNVFMGGGVDRDVDIVIYSYLAGDHQWGESCSII